MFHSPVLDVAAGLFLAYALLGLVCTALNDWIVALTQLRARCLHSAVLRLLDDPSTGLGTALFRHPLTECGASGRRPDRLEPLLVAAALADMLVGPHPTADGWRRALHSLPPCRLRRTFLLLLADVGPDAAPARVADWFERSMEHLTSWYKSRLQWLSCGVAAALCAALHADTIWMAQALWNWPVDQPPGRLHVSGLALSVIAVSRGAPFWFDLLNRASRRE